MSLNARHIKKLVSLSAVGAGAVALTADKAEADSFITYVPVNQKVGFAAGDLPSATLTVLLSGCCSFHMKFLRAFRSGEGDTLGRAIFARGSGPFGGLRFAAGTVANNSFGIYTMDIVSSGQTWFSASSGAGFNGSGPGGLWLGARSWTSDGDHWVYGNGPFDNRYALFAVGPGYPEEIFGWVQLSYSVTNGAGPGCANPVCGDNGYGPELTIQGFGYYNSPESTGVPIPAGAGSTPEPDTFALTGLAALALGAVGMRRWRAARKAA